MNDREKDQGISVKAGWDWLWENALHSPEAPEEDRSPRAGCCAGSTKEEGISVSRCLSFSIHIWVVLPLEELVFLKQKLNSLEYSNITAHTANTGFPGPRRESFL